MKKIVISLALAAFITTGIQNASFAKGPGGKGQGPKFEQKMELRQKLNLSEEQAQRAKTIRENSRSQIKPIIDELKAERAKIREMAQNGAGKEAIQAQQQKIQELMTRAKGVHKQNLDGFEQILSPDQQKQFQELKKQRMQTLKERKKYKMQQFKQEKQRIIQEQKELKGQ